MENQISNALERVFLALPVLQPLVDLCECTANHPLIWSVLEGRLGRKRSASTYAPWIDHRHRTTNNELFKVSNPTGFHFNSFYFSQTYTIFKEPDSGKYEKML